jgi:hypothetical protein
MHKLLRILSVIIATALITACSSTRHVPDGKLLLNSVKIDVGDNSEVDQTTMLNYLRQQPNHTVLWCCKLQLGVYNISGRDSTKWYNRWIRKLGEEPAIYSPELTEQSRRQLQLAMVNRGYNSAVVTVDSIKRVDKKKIDLVYHIDAGQPHYVQTVSYQFDDPEIGKILQADTALIAIPQGSHLNRDDLDARRGAITANLRDKGYYAFNKDFITFYADTLEGSKAVDLTMLVRRPDVAPDGSQTSHQRYIIGNVVFVTDYDMNSAKATVQDTVSYKDISVIYGKDHYLRPSLLYEKCYIRPDQPYSASDVNRTYEALSQLGIVKYVNIVMDPAATIGSDQLLNAYIYLSRTKKQGVSFELEGTNSEGDLGFGLGVTYRHRNLARGSELLTAKFRGSYESLSGDLDGLINNRYTEFSGEVGITFPKFEAPFISNNFKKRVKASTEFALSFNHQERPEYTRIIFGGAWKYRWVNRQNTMRHTYDFVDINFVHLPRSTTDFINTIAPDNPLLRYSYEDHLIMRMGYTYYRTNRIFTSAAERLKNAYQSNIWTIRASIETAGNFLYAISSIVGQNRSDGAYKIFNTPYSQYAKVDFDYSRSHYFNRRTSLAWHVGAGLGVPYGNSSMIPFEKRFYAGGANSVRGWGVRTLGPGSYDSRNSVTDFINQCGDIRLDLNVEYRMKLFWVMEGAIFVDAGNIWTIHNYQNQPGGMFKFNRFYKEIAAAYGIGIRLDFDYFLLRLDLGMKAHNPAQGQEPWPLINPKWGRDATFHFSIGYPF